MRRVAVMLALRGTNEMGGAKQFQMPEASPGKQAARWVGVPPEGISLVEIGDGVNLGPTRRA